MNDVIARYLDCRNETDPVMQRTLINDVWPTDTEYIDPLGPLAGGTPA